MGKLRMERFVWVLELSPNLESSLDLKLKSDKYVVMRFRGGCLYKQTFDFHAIYPATAAADAAHFSNSRRRCLRVLYIRGTEWPIFIIIFWVVTVTVARPNLVYA